VWTAESQETYVVAALATVSGGESGHKSDGRGEMPHRTSPVQGVVRNKLAMWRASGLVVGLERQRSLCCSKHRPEQTVGVRSQIGG
jgi:hypothetical protein